MRPSLRRSLGRAFACLALVLVAACVDDQQPLEPVVTDDPDLGVVGGAQAFRVYSQNVYLGGDTGPILTLDFGDIPAVIAATNLFWNDVQSSDVSERMSRVVDQIQWRRPHLVGLQEAFQFVVVELGSGTPQVVGVTDLLAEIEAEIASRGLPYEVVTVQNNTSTGTAFGLPLTPTRILQFTDRIAVLRRTDVQVDAVDQGAYAAAFSVGPLNLTRGWIRVSTTHRGQEHHFVTTHLETQGLAPVQAGQAAELLGAVVADLDGVTILAGDLNSDANNPGAPSWTPTYDAVIDAGFTDVWLRTPASRRDPGFTCCQNPDLRNGPSMLDERIDFVLVRAPDLERAGRIPGLLRADVVLDRQVTRTPTNGLWPADHAGLVAGIQVPRARGR